MAIDIKINPAEQTVLDTLLTWVEAYASHDISNNKKALSEMQDILDNDLTWITISDLRQHIINAR